MPSLSFSIDQQCGKEWCWIAVAICVAKYYDASFNLTQGKLANALLNQTTCDITPCASNALVDSCDKPGPVQQSLAHVGHLRTAVPTAILFSGVKKEIDAQPIGHPICAGIEWIDASIGHAVIIVGYEDGNGSEWVQIADPGDSSLTWMPFTTFLQTYHNKGIWTNTFFTEA